MNGGWSAFVRAGCFFSGVLLGALLLVAGCGGDQLMPSGQPDDSRPDGTGSPCSPRTAYDCVGRGGCKGTQYCGADNLLGSCVCDPIVPDAGTGIADTHDADVATPDASSPLDAGAHDAGKKAKPGKQEICDNSKDDDGDGDIDCADSDCAARMCAPKAPAGWTGPTIQYAGDDPPDCAGAYPDEVAQGGTVADADDADCSTCSCDEASVACASVLDFVTGAESACDGAACTQSVTAACTELSCPYLGASSGTVGSALPAHLAQCTPSVQTPDVPDDADWGARMVACAPDAELRQGGCAEGDVCAPKTPFDGDICIVKTGDHACPVGQYSKRHVYFERIEDTRSCSACTCDHDCAYKWQVFADADTACATATQELTEKDQCVAVTPTAGKIRARAEITGTGACNASGGAPTGRVGGKDAITVCCVE